MVDCISHGILRRAAGSAARKGVYKNMQSDHFWFLFQFLREVEKDMSKDEMKQVMIEKAINLKLVCDYVVSCSYGDIVLIICMLHDYVKMLDEVKNDDIQWKAYYRGKFVTMADRLAGQIDYDYDAAVEKCRKKQEKEERNSDIGEDAMVLAVRSGGTKKDHGKETQNKDESNSEVSGE